MTKTCTYVDETNDEQCPRPLKAKGLCAGHWYQQRHGKDLTPIQSYSKQCSVAGCFRKHRTKSYCSTHYDHFLAGKSLEPLGSPREHRAQEGDTRVGQEGYVREKCSGHPHADKYGWVRQHTKVMCDFLGRALEPHESVHHKNGIRSDNRLENLELWSTSQPYGQRVEDKYKYCLEFIKTYESLFETNRDDTA